MWLAHSAFCYTTVSLVHIQLSQSPLKFLKLSRPTIIGYFSFLLHFLMFKMNLEAISFWNNWCIHLMSFLQVSTYWTIRPSEIFLWEGKRCVCIYKFFRETKVELSAWLSWLKSKCSSVFFIFPSISDFSSKYTLITYNCKNINW